MRAPIAAGAAATGALVGVGGAGLTEGSAELAAVLAAAVAALVQYLLALWLG